MIRIKNISVLAAGFLGLITSPAWAVPFLYELDGNAIASFGDVTVTQNGDDLDFTIDYGTEDRFGPNADLHQFAFNTVGTFTGEMIIADNAPTSPYTISPGGPLAGNAGSTWDYVVNFGNGGGPPGNGILQLATFTVSFTEAISVSDLFELSSTNNTPDIHFAAHFQNTNVFGADSEAAGGVWNGTTKVPEPGTLGLLGVGLVGLGLARRKKTA